MRDLLSAVGLTVVEGAFSLRLRECPNFVFQHYGGDLGPPSIEADADSLEDLVRDAGVVSRALARAGVRHRFEVYDEKDMLKAYIQHDWPATE